MNEIYFEKIEAYLNDEMSSEDHKTFELEISTNDDLSSTLNIYKAVEREGRSSEKLRSDEIALKNTLHTLSKKYFTTNTATATPVVSINRTRIYKMVAAVAACLIIIISSYFIFLRSRQDSQQIAFNYTKSNLSHLSLTMDASRDSLQLAMDLYNRKEYNKALAVFEELYQKNTFNTDALKYIGIVYLVSSDYENALKYFDLLSQKHLFSNPGMFLQAVTLLERNKNGDKERAKALLEQVVKDKAEGSEEAEEWVKKL